MPLPLPLNPAAVELLQCSDRNLPHNVSYYRNGTGNNAWLVKLRQSVHTSEIRLNIFTPYTALGTVVVQTQEEFLEALSASGYLPATTELRRMRIDGLMQED